MKPGNSSITYEDVKSAKVKLDDLLKGGMRGTVSDFSEKTETDEITIICAITSLQQEGRAYFLGKKTVDEGSKYSCVYGRQLSSITLTNFPRNSVLPL